MFEVQEQFKTFKENETEIEHTDDDDCRQHNLNTNIVSRDSTQLRIPIRCRKDCLVSDNLKMTICILNDTAAVASLVNLVINGDINIPNRYFLPATIFNIKANLRLRDNKW
jgi:hypothetical protein